MYSVDQWSDFDKNIKQMKKFAGRVKVYKTEEHDKKH